MKQTYPHHKMVALPLFERVSFFYSQLVDNSCAQCELSFFPCG